MSVPSERHDDDAVSAGVRAGQPPVGASQPRAAEAGIRAGEPPAPAVTPRARASRSPSLAFLIVMGVLLAILVTLGVLQVVGQRQPFADPQLLPELAKANFADPPYPKTPDWPQWRGPNRDGLCGETGLLQHWPQSGPRTLWQIKKIGRGYSSVAVVGDRIYTQMQDGKNEAVVCLSVADGAELWRYRYPAYFGNEGEGPRSTPAVDSDRVFTVGATGVMHCLKTHPATAAGEVLWSKNLLEEFGAANLKWGVSFSPLVDGGLVYVNPGGKNGNSVAALDKYTGEVRWRNLDDAASYSSPVLATLAGQRQVLFFTAAALVGLDPDEGKLLWRFPWETSYGCNIATPIVAGDYVFISSGYGTGCAMIKIETAAKGLQTRLVYRNENMRNHHASSVRHGNHIYGMDESPELRCLDIRTGEIAWAKKGFGTGSLTIADGRLFVVSDDGRLTIAEATPEAYRQQSSRRIVDTHRCWAVPVISAGRLYVRDRENLTCLELRKQ